jgi:hypothetical protein
VVVETVVEGQLPVVEGAVVVETVVEGQLPVVEGSSRTPREAGVDQQFLSCWEEDFVEGGALGSDGADD